MENKNQNRPDNTFELIKILLYAGVIGYCAYVFFKY
jgi:hypothetical protein